MGAAYVFSRSASGWSQQQKLMPQGAAQSTMPDSGFGQSVALSGTAAAVASGGIAAAGMEEADWLACGYVYLRSGSAWALQNRLIAGDAGSYESSGRPRPSTETGSSSGSPDDVSDPSCGSAYGFAISLQADTTPPQTTAKLSATGSDRAYDGWHDGPVTVTFSAMDASGCDATAYCLGTSGDFHFYVPGVPLTVKEEGETPLQYTTSDFAGNAEPVKTTPIRVDTRPPNKSMTRSVTTRRGRTTKIPFRVNDPLPGSGKVKVTILILKNGHVVPGGTVKVPGKPSSNAWQVCSWRCKVSRGTYKTLVTAADLAGNDQVFFSAYTSRLTVR